MPSRITLGNLLINEQLNISARYNKFHENGIADLFNRMFGLMQDFLAEVEQQSSLSAYAECKRVNGTLVISWKLRLWMHMYGSSLSQFIFATSHILWGHASEAYGHVRHAIENAGIAHLSLSEADVAELYRTSKEYELSNRYPTRILFPISHPLTRELNRMIRRASRNLHGNLHSNSLRIIEESYSDECVGETGYFSFTFTHNDDMSFEQIWEACFFVMTAAYHVSRLYAETYALPDCDWYKQLDIFKADLDKTDENFLKEIRKHQPS